MSKEALQKELINFQIKAVDLINNTLTFPKTPSATPPQNFNFNINLEQQIDQANKTFVVITTINVTPKDDKNSTLGAVTTACVFEIKNFEEVIKFDKEVKAQISPDVLDILNSISISSTRGVMSQIFRGTFLHFAVLPIVDPKAFRKTEG